MTAQGSRRSRLRGGRRLGGAMRSEKASADGSSGKCVSGGRTSGGVRIHSIVGILTLALLLAGGIWTVTSLVATDRNVSLATGDAAAGLAEVTLVVVVILLAALIATRIDFKGPGFLMGSTVKTPRSRLLLI